MAAPYLPLMKVTTRAFSLEELVSREWGASFRAPDHRIYVFSNGRGFDSTDMGTTGIYRRGITGGTGPSGGYIAGEGGGYIAGEGGGFIADEK